MDSRKDLTQLEQNYLVMLQSLLPPGPAWNKEYATYNQDGSIKIPQSNMTSLLSGIAKEFARLHNRVLNLVTEANPLFTYETIYSKYAEAGLPDNCSLTHAYTIEQMRIEILHRWTTLGGASLSFIAALLSASGYTYTIKEFIPLTMGMPINRAIASSDWITAINIHLTGVNETWYRANKSSAQDYLHTWQTNSVFCYINKIIPAHVTVNYTFN